MATATDIVREGGGRPITRGRLLVIHAVLAVIVVGHLYDIARQQEHWPFSNYPMWARLSKDWHVKAVVPVGLTDDSPPREVRLMKDEAYFAPMPLQYQRLTFQGVARSPKRAGARDKVLGDYLGHYERRREAGLHGGPPLAGLRLYEHTWDMDTRASNAGTPDRTTLMYEYPPATRKSPDTATAPATEDAPRAR